MLACTSVLLALGAQAPPVGAEAAPEMVILPPKPEDGAKPDVAMQIWKATVLEVEKAKAALGVSVRLQGEAKAALAGPARDQAWECKGEIPCLVELGHTLGAAGGLEAIACAKVTGGVRVRAHFRVWVWVRLRV